MLLASEKEIILRITLIIESRRRDDALLVLETVGFAREGPDEASAASDRFEVTGELPEKSLPELRAIDGVLDWKAAPVLEPTDGAEPKWPWSQNPETD
ncbi:MAG: hypothetical protein AAB554_02305 [Patescibacteria group bacterium]